MLQALTLQEKLEEKDSELQKLKHELQKATWTEEGKMDLASDMNVKEEVTESIEARNEPVD